MVVRARTTLKLVTVLLVMIIVFVCQFLCYRLKYFNSIKDMILDVVTVMSSKSEDTKLIVSEYDSRLVSMLQHLDKNDENLTRMNALIAEPNAYITYHNNSLFFRFTCIILVILGATALTMQSIYGHFRTDFTTIMSA